MILADLGMFVRDCLWLQVIHPLVKSNWLLLKCNVRPMNYSLVSYLKTRILY